MGVAAMILAVAVAKPALFRGFYRRGMTVSHALGQVMGRALLAIIFLIMVVPMGIALRLLGKDLLEFRSGSSSSYWRRAKPSRGFDRMT